MPEESVRRRAAFLTVTVLALLLVVLAWAPAGAEPSGSATPAPRTTSEIPDVDTSGGDRAGGDRAGGDSPRPGAGDGVATFARIDISSITPTLVTTAGPATVSVSGVIRNTGDRPLRTVAARLERGDRVTDAAGLRTAPAADVLPVAVSGPFRPLTDVLQPGGQTGFTLTLPLSRGGLEIAGAGVYPVTVNVNATPDYGAAARVAGSTTLLPVLSLPADRSRAADYVEPDTITPDTGNPDTGNPGTGVPDTGVPDTGITDNAATGPVPDRDGSVPADKSNPSRMTMLWPLAAPPQLAPGTLGGRTEPVRLISDDLSGSLAPGGRLHRSLEALRSLLPVTTPGETGAPGAESTSAEPTPTGSARTESTPEPTTPEPTVPEPTTGTPGSGSGSTGRPSAPTASGTESTRTRDPAPDPDDKTTRAALRKSLCLAVDPDLLITVRVMATGYVISRDPSSPTSETTPGKGTEVATRWLATLKQVAGELCVVALPFASADLDSLARVDNAGLTAAALTSPADIVDSILGIKSVRGITVPAIGTLDNTGAGVLKSATVTKAVSSAATLTPDRDPDPSGRYQVGDIRVQTTDAPVTAALAALGTAPATPVLTPRSQIVDLDRESAVSRRQSAAAALAFAALTPPHSAASTPGQQPTRLPVSGRSQFIVPPVYWSPTAADTDTLLTTAAALLDAGVATPEGLDTVVSELDTARRPGRLRAPPGKPGLSRGWWLISRAQAAAISTHADLSLQLQASLVRSADVEATPERYLAPLREDLLRALRSPDRDSPVARTALGAHRDRWVSAVNSTLTRMRGSVAMLDPGGRYTLASERSPILLVVRNELALPIRVSLKIGAPAELNIGDVGVVEIPARGTRQIQLPANADSSEATSVSIGLTTATGLALGQPITISVHSNAYGKPLFYTTIVAAMALVALVARRLWHRFRGQPDPADADRPEADDHDRVLAASTYEFRRESSEHTEHIGHIGGPDQYRRGDDTDRSGPGPSGDPHPESPHPESRPPEDRPPEDRPSEDRGDDA